MGAKPNLFVGIETDADFPVLYFRVLQQVNHGLYNFSYAGLVISA